MMWHHDFHPHCICLRYSTTKDHYQLGHLLMLSQVPRTWPALYRCIHPLQLHLIVLLLNQAKKDILYLNTSEGGLSKKYCRTLTHIYRPPTKLREGNVSLVSVSLFGRNGLPH